MRHLMSVSFAALVLLCAAGCAPLYAPSAFNVAGLNGAKDAHVEGTYGTQGFQANGAYALSDHIAFRAGAQRHLPSRDSVGDDSLSYTAFTGGVGVLFNPARNSDGNVFATGFRSSLNLDVGGGTENGTSSVNSGANEIRYVTKGGFFISHAQLDTLYEGEYFALGAAMRFTYLHQRYSPESTGAGLFSQANFLIAEPGVLLRVGPRHIYGQVQMGFSIPIAEDAPSGWWDPFILAIGLGSNF